MQTSTRRGISFPSADRSDRPDIPAHFANLIAALELDVSYSSGTLAGRPASPAYPGYLYWGTDTHLMYFWDGASWWTLGTTDVIAQTLINAKGDLVVGTADNIATRMGAGTNNQVLFSDNTQATGLKWALETAVDLIAAKGDILVGTAADTLARIAVGANGQALLADSAQTAGIKWGPPVIPNQSAYLSSSVNMTNANQFYDGPNLSLTAGTYFVTAKLLISTSGSSKQITVKLWDGTNVFSTAEEEGNARNMMYVHAIITPVTTTTYKVSAACTNTSGTINSACPDNSSGNFAGQITAIQLA